MGLRSVAATTAPELVALTRGGNEKTAVVTSVAVITSGHE
jgi:hypothetical protein